MEYALGGRPGTYVVVGLSSVLYTKPRWAARPCVTSRSRNALNSCVYGCLIFGPMVIDPSSAVLESDVCSPIWKWRSLLASFQLYVMVFNAWFGFASPASPGPGL